MRWVKKKYPYDECYICKTKKDTAEDREKWDCLGFWVICVKCLKKHLPKYA